MISKVRNRFGFWVLVLCLAFTIIFSGCSAFRSGSNPQASSEQVVEQRDNKNAPLYYDFGDVLVPRQLTVDKKLSFVYRTPGFSAGVLSLKGRVEINSLIVFFSNNMVKDNWDLVSSFKSMRTIMLFQKENRWCVINITEKDFYTYVEIWVSPTIKEPKAVEIQ
ncbi:MAG: hypothetical protein PHY82_02730 [Lentisphaeria bacterium]|nr:hypothetical protein [Lentisphaeria bacterium]